MIISEAIEYVNKLFAGNSDGHGADHTMRVYHNAQILMEAYPEADGFAISLSALLHDADDYKLFSTENNANARTFAYGGKAGRGLSDSIKHFYDKLLLLKEEMNTDAAKEMAQKRHEYMKDFLEEYYLETGYRYEG